MTSLFAQLFLSIQTRIKSAVPEIAWIDQDLGQIDWYQTRPPVSWPCVMIDFPETGYGDLSQGVQWATPVIRIRLGFSPFSSANSVAPDISKEAALQFYEIENKLFKALQGFDGGGITQPMTRTSVVNEKRNDPYRVRQMTFTTATEDSEAQNSLSLQEALLNLIVQ